MKIKCLFTPYLMVLMLIISELSYGQIDTTQQHFSYSASLQRLQLKLITSFVYFSLRGQIDLDSAARIVSDGENLPFSLYYNEDFGEGEASGIKQLLNNGSYFLFKPGTYKNDLDSALHYLLLAKTKAVETKDVYWQNAALAMLGKFYQQFNDPKKSTDYFSQAVQLSRSAGNTHALTLALANRGTYANYDDPQKEKDLNEALKLARLQGNKEREIDMLTRIYEIYFVKGNYDTVNKQLLQVISLKKLIGFKHLHYDYNVLAFLDFNIGDYSSMFSNASSAVALMESMKDYAFSNFFYGAMANNYSIFDDYPKAIEWYQKCINAEKTNKLKRVWYGQLIMILSNMSGAGQPRDAIRLISKMQTDYPPVFNIDKMNISSVLAYSYQLINEAIPAKKYYLEMLRYIDSCANDPSARPDILNGYLNVSSFYFDQGEISLAKQYFDKTKGYTGPISLHDKGRIFWEQFRLDSAAGHYPEALKQYRLARAIDDSLYSINKNKQIAEMQVHFDTKNKDRNIELLTQKEKAQETAIHQSNLIKNFTLAGIVLMIIITGLIYTQYRNKQLSNKQMQLSNTQINEKNIALQQLVKDKDWLVKEIHHRVKNNLQTIVSLLESQSLNLTSDAREAVQDSRNRIYTMSLIHQKLYQKDLESSINMSLFLPDLVDNLRDSFDTKGRIRFINNIEPIILDISQATPVGLILNEAIINAIKYAFPTQTKNNEIHIYIGKGLGTDIEFEVSDNGKGLPENFEEKAASGLGIKLMRGLTEELHGHLYMSSSNGTKISIRFTPKVIPTLSA